MLGRLVFLVSGAQLPVEEHSLPLHLVGREPRETEDAVARLVAGRPEWWQHYGGWLAALHPQAYRGVLHMAKAKKEKFGFDLEPLVETMGLDWVLDKLGVDRVVNELGPDPLIEHLEKTSKRLTPEQRRRLKRLGES